MSPHRGEGTRRNQRVVEADRVGIETSAAMRNLQRIWSGKGRRQAGGLIEFRPQKSGLEVVWNGRKQSEMGLIAVCPA